MKVLTYIEIDIPYCSLSYGVAPCEAAIGVTGTAKCFNSLATCQDRDNFNNDPLTLRFAMDTAYLPSDIPCIPSIKDVSFTPSILSLGKDLGQRATLSVTFTDHPHNDTGAGFDKYYSEREYDPQARGTFWGKFRARQPYLTGRPIRIIRGYVGQSLNEMTTRHFIIESFDGPKLDGTFTITGKDVLKLADGDKAQAPALSSGFLAAEISAIQTSAQLSPTGIGDDEYPSSGYLTIGGNEVVSFTRSGDDLTIVRAQIGTVASAHSAQDRVQTCLRYEAADPADIIADLLENYAAVPSAYIPITSWQQETSLFLQRQYTGTIADPTPVKELVSELIEQCALAMWWNDAAQLIKLQVLRGILTNAVQFTQENILEGTYDAKEQPDSRLSQVWIYYGKIDPTAGADDPDNYRSAAAVVNLELQNDYGSPIIKKIYSRWIPDLGRPIALRLGAILLGRFQVPPRRFSFELHRHYNADDVASMGLGARITSWPLQDETGLASALTAAEIQLTRVDPKIDRFSIEAEEMIFSVSEDFNDRSIIIETDVNNFNLRTSYDLLYPTPVDGDEVTIIIETSVVVGSTSASQPSFIVGEWPIGVILNMTLRGRIAGCGGRGGEGGRFGINFSQAGEDAISGGTALYTRFPISITAAAGNISGGGGGGGGAGGPGGGGGGGGAGRNVGPGAGGGGSIPPFTTSGESGQPGTLTSGGVGGKSAEGDRYGGRGGGPGESGTDGDSHVTSAGNKGTAGAAIDGDSYVTLDGTYDIAGPRIN